ncbi:MAG: putative methyltransferase [Bacillota bacterium]|jgi:ubiquinone/menaquinone biosynthesis C-methylase UbiE|nr:putative methyltransferase [Bacillota bacterium]
MNALKKTVMNSKNHFNASAEGYDDSFDGKYVRPMYVYLLERLSREEAGCFLDIGCGTGTVLINLVNGKRRLYGIDLSEKMVEISRDRLQENAVIEEADAERLPFEDNLFDLVLCNASFHHYPNPREVLQEIRRVLKPQGTLIIGEGYAFQPFRLLLNLYFRFADTGDFHSYGIHEFRKLLQRSGFQRIESNRIGMRLFLEAKAGK